MTLFEVLVSIVLIIMLLGAMLTFYWQTGEVREQAERIANRTQLARQVLERLASELRGCLGKEQLGFGQTEEDQVEQRLVGERRSITFMTTAMPERGQYRFYEESDELPPAVHDLRLLTYRLWVDPENTTEDGEPIVGGVLRTEMRTFNQFVVEEDDPRDIRTDVWSHELGYLEFRYFDGVEWDTKWDITEGNSLPQLVEIIVGFDTISADELNDADLEQHPLTERPEFNPNRYSTIVKIPAADKFFGSRFQRVGKQFSEQLGVEGGK